MQGVPIDFAFGCGSSMTYLVLVYKIDVIGFIAGGGIDVVFVSVSIHLVFVWVSELAWFLCRGIQIDLPGTVISEWSTSLSHGVFSSSLNPRPLNTIGRWPSDTILK